MLKTIADHNIGFEKYLVKNLKILIWQILKTEFDLVSKNDF